MPFTGPLVTVVFLLGFIPYLGGIVATLVVGLATQALVGGGPAIAVMVGLAAAALLEDRLLADTPIGRQGDVHPALVLLAIPAGATLFGLFGLITAVPVTLFAITVTRPILDTLDIGPAVAAATRPGGPTWAVPFWLDRLAQVSWRALVGVGLVVLGIEIVVAVPVIVVPVVLGIVIAATLLPLMNRLLRLGWTRGVAAAATTFGATVAIVAAFLVTVIWTVGPLRELTETTAEGAQDVDLGVAHVRRGRGLGVDLAGAGRGAARPAGRRPRGRAAAVADVLLPARRREVLGRGDRSSPRRAPGAPRRRPANARSTSCPATWSGRRLISLFGAITSALIMVILGLPLAMPIGVLTFFGGFIPYIGSFITTALAFLVAVAVGTRRRTS